MYAHHLANSVRYHAKTPITVWDGTDFVASDVLVNIKSVGHLLQPKPTSTMGTVGDDPLAGIFTFKDSADQVWNIVDSTKNTYENTCYGTTYTVRKAPYKIKIYSGTKKGVVSGSGFSYEKLEEDTPLVDWALFEHDRYFSSPRPTSRLTTDQIFYGFLPNAALATKNTYVVLEDGSSYQVTTVDKTVSVASSCFFMLRGNG